MTIADLFFLASLLFVVVCLVAILISALHARLSSLRRWAKFLFTYIAVYAAALITASLFLPRRIYPTGERRCWDDWCATALRVVPASDSAPLSCASGPVARVWVVQIGVSSAAKRIRQRAPDARAELEDEQGVRYSPCGAPVSVGTAPPRSLADPLGPGESFSVLVPFRLPIRKQPAGIVMHHGDFPGVVIIGSDSSAFHRPALQQVVVGQR